jgi:hypothetical protein
LNASTAIGKSFKTQVFDSMAFHCHISMHYVIIQCSSVCLALQMGYAPQ